MNNDELAQIITKNTEKVDTMIALLQSGRARLAEDKDKKYRIYLHQDEPVMIDRVDFSGADCKHYVLVIFKDGSYKTVPIEDLLYTQEEVPLVEFFDDPNG